jgi:hypothetical protein
MAVSAFLGRTSVIESLGKWWRPAQADIANVLTEEGDNEITPARRNELSARSLLDQQNLAVILAVR